jgi:hypothetical protein
VGGWAGSAQEEGGGFGNAAQEAGMAAEHRRWEYLTRCHHMGVSGNRFATHERGVNVRGIN